MPEDKEPEILIGNTTEIIKIIKENIKLKQEKLNFIHHWKGLKYLCRDNNDAWEYWLGIYKKLKGD